LALAVRIHPHKAHPDLIRYSELAQLLILLQLAELSLQLVVVLVVHKQMVQQAAAAVAAVETAAPERQGHQVKVAREEMV
jgi:hypothetical protein